MVDSDFAEILLPQDAQLQSYFEVGSTRPIDRVLTHISAHAMWRVEMWHAVCLTHSFEIATRCAGTPLP